MRKRPTNERGQRTPSAPAPKWRPLEARPHTKRRVLWRAVQRYALAEWRRETGRRWDERASCDDRELPAHERRAVTVAAQLRAALLAIAEFAADYRRLPDSQVVVGPDGAALAASETFQTRQLLRVVEERLSDLDPRVEDTRGKKILINAQRRPRRPGWFAFLEYEPGGWRVPSRQRIVILLRDHLGYWKRVGLPGPADNRTMAIASLLCGNRPGQDEVLAISAGVTVLKVVEAEMAAIRQAVSKVRQHPGVANNPHALAMLPKKSPGRPKKRT